MPLSNDLDASECGFFTIQHEMKEVYQPSLFQLTIFLGYYFDFLNVVLRMTPFTFCLLDRICHHNDCRLPSLSKSSQHSVFIEINELRKFRLESGIHF